MMALAVAAAAGCGSDGSDSPGPGTAVTASGKQFPAEVRKNFIAGCTSSGGSRSQCECALEKVEGRYTLAEYTRLELEANQDPSSDAGGEVAEVIAECVAEAASTGAGLGGAS
jgi:hypothetical protein